VETQKTMKVFLEHFFYALTLWLILVVPVFIIAFLVVTLA